MPLPEVLQRSRRWAATGVTLALLACSPGWASAQSMAGGHDTAPPAFAAGDSMLGLDAFQRAVLARNPSLTAMHAAVREARARADEAGALDDPMLEAEVAPRSLGAGGAEAGYRLGVSQTLPLFGQRGLGRRAAAAEAEVAHSDYATARLDLIRETRAAFYDDYHFGQVRATSVQLLDWMRHARAAALARYAAGTSPQQDVLDADVEIAMLDHQAVMAERNRLLVEARIRSLLHLDPLAPLPQPPDTLRLPDRDEARLMVMRSNERTRPELTGAEAQLAAAQARLALARRTRWPEAQVGFAYDRTMAEPELRPLVTASLTAPLSLGRHAAAERAAQASIDAASARLDAARDALQRRITEASTQFEESLHELEVLRDELLPAAERSLTVSRAGYEAGRTDFAALIRSVRNELDARLEYHRTLASANQARAELERALGEPALPATEGAER